MPSIDIECGCRWWRPRGRQRRGPGVLVTPPGPLPEPLWMQESSMSQVITAAVVGKVSKTAERRARGAERRARAEARRREREERKVKRAARRVIRGVKSVFFYFGEGPGF